MTSPVVRESRPALHIARVPGELGPIVRCSGELILATGEALRRELTLLASLCPAVLILNVTGCRVIDPDGVRLLVQKCERLRGRGCRFVVVAGSGAAEEILGILGPGSLLPLFPTEEAATRALRSEAVD